MLELSVKIIVLAYVVQYFSNLRPESQCKLNCQNQDTHYIVQYNVVTINFPRGCSSEFLLGVGRLVQKSKSPVEDA